MDDEREKTTLIQRDPPKRDSSPQLWTDNVFTYDAESPWPYGKEKKYIIHFHAADYFQ